VIPLRKISTTQIILVNEDAKKRRRPTHEDSKELGELNRQNSKLAEQFAALKSLTQEVQNVIKAKEEEKVREDIQKETNLSNNSTEETTEADIDEVFKSLSISSSSETLVSEKLLLKHDQTTSKPLPDTETKTNSMININDENDLLTLFPTPKPYIPLPSSITNVLTPEVLSNITQKETASWEPVIDALLKSDICNPLTTEIIQDSFTSFDFHKLITSIPRNQKAQLVEKLHELALLSGVLWGNVAIMNDLLALCNLLPTEKSHMLVTLLLRDIDIGKINDSNEGNDVKIEEDDKIVANVTTKAILLNHYARLSDVDKVREYISELNELPDSKNPMKTSPVIYTSIMQMYMRLNNYNLAKETFDTMKFLSLSTSPSPRTYTSMILLDTLNNNVEHGISVYNEMIEKEIKVEPQALLALAKGCGARRGMVSQGWEFIIEYYENGYPVDSQVMEIMMYLAYVDGDLPFVRGIWMNICETNTKLSGHIELPHPKCTKWLFNTYYKIGDIVQQAKNGKSHMPVGLVDPRVSSIRTKVLELTNLKFHADAPPLLPLKNFDGADQKLMLNEARALWKYILLTVNKHYIGEELIEAYLYVVGRYGLLEIFESEWNRLTFFDTEGIEKIEGKESSFIIEEPPVTEPENEVFEENDSETTTVVQKKPKFDKLGVVSIPRSDRLYNMCMHIARHQGSLSFAQKIWTERGIYRKSSRFQTFSIEKQDEADFKFARLMLSTLTHTGNVGDAYKLVLSSQNRFVWTKYHLKSLLILCERLGYVTFTKELVKVTKRGEKWNRRQLRKRN
jgi:hypothetical protein